MRPCCRIAQSRVSCRRTADSRLGRPQPDFERARQRKLSLLLTITVLLLEQLIAMMNEVRFQTVDLFINCLLGRNWR